MNKQFALPQEVLDIFTKMQTAGFEVFLVGGAVRDLLLGREVSDWDFTTNATPEEVQTIFPDSFYDNAFGTVGIKPVNAAFDPHEITTYRTEQGYSDNRRPDKVAWGKSLEEDLKRRDFTINALALDADNSIIDLYEGQGDLEKKLIRAVGEPTERFSEDALRMMRAIRIAAELQFTIDDNTQEAIKTCANLIEKIAKERVRDELFKIFISPAPDHGILLLKDTGLLSHILPELEKGFGVEQKSPERHHIYDVGTHSVMALKFANTNDPVTKLAILIHDIGKPQTYKKLPTGVITFYNHEVVGARIASQIAERLKLSSKDAEKLWRLVRWHQFVVNEHQTDSAIRRFIVNVGKENIDDMLELRRADRLGGGAKETSWRLEDFKKRLVEVQKQPFAVKDLKIDGADVMRELDIKPGPRVGDILNMLFNKVVNKEVENEQEALLKQLKEIA
jgi:tRNA nucleotidyltransferase (CCA-adding enzyme)